MPHSRLPGQKIAHFQRLCCLGLGGESVMPELMRELQNLVPSRGSAFFWAGPDLQLTNMYTDQLDMIKIAPLYLGEFHNRREREVVQTFTEYMRNDYASPVGTWAERLLKVDQRSFVKSDFYNQVLRPLGWHHVLQVQIKALGRKLGALQIARSADTAEFTGREMKLIEAVAPFIAHALTDNHAAGSFVDSEDRALVIADGRGRIHHLSENAGRFLLTAQFPFLTPGAAARMRDNLLPEAVVRLCETLAEPVGDRSLPAPPVWRHRNPWGEFVFRAFVLEPEVIAVGSQLIGISIERCEPLRLKLFRSIDELPVTHRESELCLDLVSGRTRSEIAETMGISEHTVIAHCRNLYAKLGVHTRVELAEKLRAI